MTRKENEYHVINNAINKQLSSLKNENIIFCAISEGQGKKSRESHNPRALFTANLRAAGFFHLSSSGKLLFTLENI